MTTVSAREPSKAFWTVGIAASLAVHLGLVGGAALLAGRYAQASVPTEITFSEEASPSAGAVQSTAAPTVPSEVAEAVAPETIEASAASQAAPERVEAVQPVETVTASTPERAAASASAETASTATSAERAGVSASSDAAAMIAERPTAETPASASTAESATSIAAQDAAPATGDSAERVAALEAPETIGVAPPSGAETVATSAPETVRPQALTAGSDAVASAAPGGAETVQPQAPTAGSGAVASAAPGGAETAQPAAPTSEIVTGVAPETGQPSAATTQPSGEAVGVAPGGPETAETVRPLETALLVPARPNSVLGTEVDKPTDRYRKIVDFIRGYRDRDCFIALPAMDLDGAVTFQTFGRDKAREDAFRNALGAIDELKTEISSGDVADPQCLALAFARTSQRYPGFSLVIDLNETEMASGTRLSGKVLNTAGRDLHLLLVDDEGTVQSMDSFLSAKEGVDRSFSVPLTLTGGPVATKQILMAIATDPPIWGLDKVKEPAADFFRELAAQVEASHADLDLAVEGFDVR